MGEWNAYDGYEVHNEDCTNREKELVAEHPYYHIDHAHHSILLHASASHVHQPYVGGTMNPGRDELQYESDLQQSSAHVHVSLRMILEQVWLTLMQV